MTNRGHGGTVRNAASRTDRRLPRATQTAMTATMSQRSRWANGPAGGEQLCRLLVARCSSWGPRYALVATDGVIAPKVVLPRSSSYSSETGALGMNARANEAASSEIMSAAPRWLSCWSMRRSSCESRTAHPRSRPNRCGGRAHVCRYAATSISAKERCRGRRAGPAHANHRRRRHPPGADADARKPDGASARGLGSWLAGGPGSVRAQWARAASTGPFARSAAPSCSPRDGCRRARRHPQRRSRYRGWSHCGSVQGDDGAAREAQARLRQVRTNARARPR